MTSLTVTSLTVTSLTVTSLTVSDSIRNQGTPSYQRRNLLGGADGLLRPSVRSLAGARFLLTCAALMTSSHSKAKRFGLATSSASARTNAPPA